MLSQALGIFIGDSMEPSFRYSTYDKFFLTMKSYSTFKSRLLKNTEVKKQYAELEPEFALIRLLIEKRNMLGMSQQELAQKMGTKQSAISRFESGTYNPTLHFLHKVTNALDAKMTVTIT